MNKPDFQKMVCFLGVTKDLEANYSADGYCVLCNVLG